MKSIMLAAAAALAVGTAPLAYVRAATPELAPVVVDRSADAATIGTTPLAALLAEWDRAGFSEPSKPSQYRVYGRNGYAISGPEYRTLVSLIRTAEAETMDGHDRDATVIVARARSLLAAATVSDLAGTMGGSNRRAASH